MSVTNLTTEAPPPSNAPALTAYLESLVTACIQGMNACDLSDDLNVWPIVADDFTSAGMGYQATTKEGFLDDYLMYRKGYPEHHMSITRMETTFDSRFIKGHVYANVTVTGGHGVPIGMSRKVVIVCEFQKCEGRWMLVASTSLPGEDGVAE